MIDEFYDINDVQAKCMVLLKNFAAANYKIMASNKNLVMIQTKDGNEVVFVIYFVQELVNIRISVLFYSLNKNEEYNLDDYPFIEPGELAMGYSNPAEEYTVQEKPYEQIIQVPYDHFDVVYRFNDTQMANIFKEIKQHIVSCLQNIPISFYEEHIACIFNNTSFIDVLNKVTNGNFEEQHEIYRNTLNLTFFTKVKHQIVDAKVGKNGRTNSLTTIKIKRLVENTLKEHVAAFKLMEKIALDNVYEKQQVVQTTKGLILLPVITIQFKVLK